VSANVLSQGEQSFGTGDKENELSVTSTTPLYATKQQPHCSTGFGPLFSSLQCLNICPWNIVVNVG